MLMEPSNFLLLDEPTNHLDMRAKDVLLTALQEFNGTLVFVSHDRYFIDKLASRIFEVENGEVRVYPGNYEDYLWRKSGGPERVASALPRHSRPETNGTAPAAENKLPEKRVNPIKLKLLEDRRAALEAKVGKTENEIAELETSLGNFVSAEETVRLNDQLIARRSALEKLVAEWEDVVQSIEAHA
jgi:ATP-binding cassette subfamily F protein 3